MRRLLIKLIIIMANKVPEKEKEEIFDKGFNRIAFKTKKYFEDIFYMAEKCNVKDTQGFLNLLDTLNEVSIMY